MLVGAAGTYDPERHPVGSAVVAGRIRCDGIGAGPAPATARPPSSGSPTPTRSTLGDGAELLSVAAAAGSPAEAADRRARHPGAAGEEMEGYAVAVAARLCGVGLTIVRGFSNVAGERDRARLADARGARRAAGARAGGGRMKLRLGLSTCPNDTFAFHAILERRIDLRGLEFDAELLDVQQLNDGLFAGRYDVSKASFYAALLLAGDYGVVRAGSALGFGVGPLIVAARPDVAPETAARVLCPGETTTATLLYRCLHPGQGEIHHAVFSDIGAALRRGDADLGVLIHEGRLTYERDGLVAGRGPGRSRSSGWRTRRCRSAGSSPG